MRVVTVRHHDEDDPGFVGESLTERGFELTVVDVANGQALPDPAGYDGVLVLGAKWSVTECDEIAWMRAELDWLRRVDAAGVPILGICFGAQAMSVALGGRVERAPRPEIGWTMVEPAPTGEVEAGPWLQFHEDRCLPPPEAEILAVNDVAVQAFRIGAHLAVQFHPEVDGAQLQRWIDNGEEAAVAAAGLDREDLLAATLAQEPAARRRADRIVALWLARHPSVTPPVRETAGP